MLQRPAKLALVTSLLATLASSSVWASDTLPSADEAQPTRALPDKTDEAAEAKAAKTSEAERQMDAMRAEKKRLELEVALDRTRQQRELAKLESKRKAIVTRLALDDAKRKLALSELEAETAKLTAERRSAEQKLAIEQLKFKREIATLDSEHKLQEAKTKARRRVSEAVVYRAKPFRDGVLSITDRRIPLNGPITMATADTITQKLHFFNNQSDEHPVFLVIDYSPGGSVMAGYRILKAMEASEAPVHVVVKSFAASMAAVITTRAEHSYAYPNAMILHHQISSGNGGNLTQQQERLKEAAEWSRRLLGPVHGKMGISHDQLVARMYREDSDGDWKVFADEALKLKWVDHIVNDVRETGVRAIDDKIMTRGPRAEHEATSAKLPRLLPSDHWFLYDPDGYYR
jgi:ATP-dependent Clp protease, protease subunit